LSVRWSWAYEDRQAPRCGDPRCTSRGWPRQTDCPCRGSRGVGFAEPAEASARVTLSMPLARCGPPSEWADSECSNRLPKQMLVENLVLACDQLRSLRSPNRVAAGGRSGRLWSGAVMARPTAVVGLWTGPLSPGRPARTPSRPGFRRTSVFRLPGFGVAADRFGCGLQSAAGPRPC